MKNLLIIIAVIFSSCTARVEGDNFMKSQAQKVVKHNEQNRTVIAKTSVKKQKNISNHLNRVNTVNTKTKPNNNIAFNFY